MITESDYLYLMLHLFMCVIFLLIAISGLMVWIYYVEPKYGSNWNKNTSIWFFSIVITVVLAIFDLVCTAVTLGNYLNAHGS